MSILSRYEIKRIEYLLSTLPAEFIESPSPSIDLIPTSTSSIPTHITHSTIKPSRIQFIAKRHHLRISSLSASLLQSTLLAIYYPAWVNLNKGTALASQIAELKSNLKTRDALTACLRDFWFHNLEEVGTEESYLENYKVVVKDLTKSGRMYSHFTTSNSSPIPSTISFSTQLTKKEKKSNQLEPMITFVSNHLEEIYLNLFERHKLSLDRKERDELLFQIEQVDIVVLVSLIKEDMNELTFRNSIITSLTLDETVAEIASRVVWGGNVTLELQPSGIYIAVCNSTKTRTKASMEGTNQISSYLEKGDPFPDLPFFKGVRATRY